MELFRHLKDFIKRSAPERWFNCFFYYFRYLRRGRIPRRLNIDHPSSFSEKIIWLKMHDSHDNSHLYTDKVLVKDFVRKAVGEKYLIPTIAVYDTAEDIDFNALPNAFVLKANHGSGWNIICPDKQELNIVETKRKLYAWLHTNYSVVSKEPQYRNIVPRILCEAYLEHSAEEPLVDYKIYCFSGVPRLVHVDFDRYGDHRRNFYDLDWNLMSFTIGYPNRSTKFPKPDSLDEMLSIARRLSQGFVFSRIDLYCLHKKIYFGEITFSPESGFMFFTPQEYDFTLGKMLTLPA